jgi:hypothetical protein
VVGRELFAVKLLPLVLGRQLGTATPHPKAKYLGLPVRFTQPRFNILVTHGLQLVKQFGVQFSGMHLGYAAPEPVASRSLPFGCTSSYLDRRLSRQANRTVGEQKIKRSMIMSMRYTVSGLVWQCHATAAFTQ